MFKRGYGDRWRDSGFDCPPPLIIFASLTPPVAFFFFIIYNPYHIGSPAKMGANTSCDLPPPK